MSISDRLLSEAKRVAVSSGRTLSQVVEDALQESLHRASQPEHRPFSLPTFRGEGLLSGVDIDDSASLQDIMDRSVGIDRLR